MTSVGGAPTLHGEAEKALGFSWGFQLENTSDQ
jgi:hypothetical protein